MSGAVDGLLVLADGRTFEGELLGAEPVGGAVGGEVVFNTVMSGYQEVISDPSYTGQIITFTAPHIGNYGVNRDDDESSRPWCNGVVLRELSRTTSNWRASGDLRSYLTRWGIPAIAGIDTRALTLHLREHGALPGAFGHDEAVVRAAAAAALGTDGRDLVAAVTTAEPYRSGESFVGTPQRRIVAVDCGLKTSILRQLAAVGHVDVVPATWSAAEILAGGPDGVFLSNGPGDPAAMDGLVSTVRDLLGRVPVFGICMGHQVLGRAIGGRTFKLAFGHHGGNHPVRDLSTGTIQITSQNHNYCVDLDGVSGAEITHVNLNDATLEGFRMTDVPAFAVQFHPEAGPGPHDSHPLFERFSVLIDGGVG